MARDLSIFVDESGNRGGKARYYLLTLVMHDQTNGIADKIAHYEQFATLTSQTYRSTSSPC